MSKSLCEVLAGQSALSKLRLRVSIGECSSRRRLPVRSPTRELDCARGPQWGVETATIHTGITHTNVRACCRGWVQLCVLAMQCDLTVGGLFSLQQRFGLPQEAGGAIQRDGGVTQLSPWGEHASQRSKQHPTVLQLCPQHSCWDLTCLPVAVLVGCIWQHSTLSSHTQQRTR